jgi:hypothetical protein
VKRDWQAVLVEIKKLKPARVQTFANTEVDVDEDGETLVIEFPSGMEFSLQLAEDAENRELVKRALAAVFGAAPAFRYQLGRGAVRPPEPVEESEPCPTPVRHVDTPPDQDRGTRAESPYETATGMTEPAAGQHAQGEEASALEQLLVQGLGATIVGEHMHDTDREDD